jgi:hypothetical protein
LYELLPNDILRIHDVRGGYAATNRAKEELKECNPRWRKTHWVYRLAYSKALPWFQACPIVHLREKADDDDVEPLQRTSE